MQPLEGLTVIEFGTSVAAPYAGMILADLGARVIKIENPKDGDYARGWGPPFWGDASTVFHSLNRGKKSVAIDFADKAQVATLREFMVAEVDGVIQNLRPGVLTKFGLDSATLRALRPSLVWCDIGAFGADGPLRNSPGYDPLVQALSGIMSVTGTGDGAPVRVGVSIVDIGSGMWAVIGFLASLIARAKHGVGNVVSGSLYETGLAWMTVPLAAHAATGEVRKAHGSGLAEIVPYQAFETRGGWLMIAAGNDRLFRNLCQVLGVPEVADRGEFTRNPDRVRNREQLVPMVAKLVADWRRDRLAAALDAVGVPNAPLQTVDQVMSHPQTKALNMVQRSDKESLALAGIPLSFDGVRPRAVGTAPALGADTVALGLSPCAAEPERPGLASSQPHGG
jgi:crotonobetainyl-CoA:carnitine CoA-transferase CaiB-like acyl-CoA transferase